MLVKIITRWHSPARSNVNRSLGDTATGKPSAPQVRRQHTATARHESVLHARNFASILPTMAGSIRDLKVWQEAVALAAETVRAARHAKRETKVVTDDIMLRALAAAGAIADGYGRYTAPEQRQLYRSARRDLLRLETSLAVAKQAGLVSPQTHTSLHNRIQIVSRLLSGYLVYLERQLGPEPATSAVSDGAR